MTIEKMGEGCFAVFLRNFFTQDKRRPIILQDQVDSFTESLERNFVSFFNIKLDGEYDKKKKNLESSSRISITSV
jgi:hypothetical protein